MEPHIAYIGTIQLNTVTLSNSLIRFQHDDRNLQCQVPRSQRVNSMFRVSDLTLQFKKSETMHNRTYLNCMQYTYTYTQGTPSNTRHFTRKSHRWVRPGYTTRLSPLLSSIWHHKPPYFGATGTLFRHWLAL